MGEKYPYTYAIHEAKNEKGEKNLHCHLMFSERELDGIDRELSQFLREQILKILKKEELKIGNGKKNQDYWI